MMVCKPEDPHTITKEEKTWRRIHFFLPALLMSLQAKFLPGNRQLAKALSPHQSLLFHLHLAGPDQHRD